MSNVKSVIKVYSSNVFSLTVTFLSFLIITKSLDKYNYGIFSIYRNIFDIIISFIFGFLNSLMLRFVSEYKSKSFVIKILILELIANLTILITCYKFPDVISTIFNKDISDNITFLLGFAIINYSIFDSIQNLLKSTKKFKEYSFNQTLSSLIYIVLIIVDLIYHKISVEKIIINQSISWIVTNFISLPHIRTTNLSEKPLPLKKIKNYLIFLFANNIINQFIYPNIIVRFIRFNSETDIAIFYFSYKIGSIVIEIFANSLFTVLFPQFCETSNKYKNRQLIMALKFLFNYGMIVATLFFLIGGHLLDIFFPKYSGTKNLITLLIISEIFESSSSIIISFLNANSKYKIIIIGRLIKATVGIILSNLLTPTLYHYTITILCYDFAAFLFFSIYLLLKKKIFISLFINKEDLIFLKRGLT